MAYVSTICRLEDAYACSIIEETGGLANVGTAVHELGHRYIIFFFQINQTFFTLTDKAYSAT